MWLTWSVAASYSLYTHLTEIKYKGFTGIFLLSVFMVNTETHQPSPLPDSPPPGFPDWPPAEQPRPGAVPAGPGSQPAGPSSVERLRSATGQPLSTALPISHSNVPTDFDAEP